MSRQGATPPRPGTVAAKVTDGTLRIGELLVELGRLDSGQVREVLEVQRSDPRRFGEVALFLGYVARGDLDLALMRQVGEGPELPIEYPTDRTLPAIDPEEYGCEALVAVRSQLVHRWFGEDPEERCLAIVSPESGDGRSYLCSRLARLFAELEEDTLIIDADLRAPSMHAIFGLDNSRGLSTYLEGSVPEPPVQAVPGVANLHVLCAGPMGGQPHRLLARKEFSRLIETVSARYRSVFIDTPAASRGADALTIALRASGALLVVRKHESREPSLRELAQRLRDSTVEVVGAVLNEVPRDRSA